MKYDVIIVGGGPAGLSSAIYLKRALKNVLLIEKNIYGGQIVTSPKVENYPGFLEISGMELGEKMLNQAKNLGVTTMSKAVIYATGASSRKLGVKNEEALIGSGISYCATCDGAFFKDKVVCVVGGGNTAIDDALYLANVARKVYVIHRRDEFRGEPVKVAILKEKENVQFILQATVKDVVGTNKVEKVVLDVAGKEETLDVDGIFVAIGQVPNTKILEDFVPLNPNGYVITNLQLETSVPGFYAAGDVREKQVRQLTTATNDGTIAAVMVGEYLDTLE